MPPTNILFITTDQQRADCLGCYGNPLLRTPHIDRLAHEGARFNRAYVNNPLCMPSRATMLTGRNPRSHRVWCNGVPLPPDEVFVSSHFAAAGYRTALVGKAHFTPYGAPIEDDGETVTEYIAGWEAGMGTGWRGPYYGFDYVDLVLAHNRPSGHYRHWLDARYPDVPRLFGQGAALEPPTGTPQCWKSAVPVEAHPTTYIADRAVEYLRGHREQHSEQPFFLWCSFTDPHHPFAPPHPYCDLYDPAAVPLPACDPRKADDEPVELRDKPPHFLDAYHGRNRTDGSGPFLKLAQMTDAGVREIIALTYGMIALLDDSIGRIWAALDDLDLWNDTLVVFCSDHADLLGDHWLMNKGPFHYEGLLRVPLLLRLPASSPMVVEPFAQLIDLAPTFLDAAALEIPFGMQGRSLLPLLRGDDSNARDAVLVENSSGELPHLMLKTIRTDGWKLTAYAGQPYGELYDLHADPDEFVNLWDSPPHQQLRQQLLARLLHELVTTEDRLPRRLCHA